MEIDLLKGFAEIISSIASLLWPLITAATIIAFRKEIRGLFSRITSGSLFGADLKFGPQIKDLETSVEKSTSELNVPPTMPPSAEQDLAAEAIRNPRGALVLVARQIERELRQWLLKTGHHANLAGRPLRETFRFLAKTKLIGPNTAESIDKFWSLRNSVVHGKDRDISEAQIIQIVDSGLQLLEAIRALPAETNKVYRPEVQLFTDPECKQKVTFGSGLILETTSPDKAVTTKRIFPTTRAHFEIGKEVSWEWNMEFVWGKCFYVDPDTREKKLAWSSSAEFVGRHIEDIDE